MVDNKSHEQMVRERMNEEDLDRYYEALDIAQPTVDSLTHDNLYEAVNRLADLLRGHTITMGEYNARYKENNG